MLTRLDIGWIWASVLLFIALNSVFIIYEIYWVSLLPVVLAVLLSVLISLENAFFFIVFFTPLSLNLENSELGGIGMFIPTEPILLFMMVVLSFRLMLNFDVDKALIRHPITLIILLQIFWMIVCAFTSERPVVSFKFILARLWFISAFYLLAIHIFRDGKKIRRFLWLYIIPLTGVIIYTVVNHYFHDFSDKPAHFVMKPFFKDHTSYGAVLAMLTPPLIYLFYHYRNYAARIYIAVVIVIFTTGIIFSYTRAAWISLGCGLILLLIYKLKIRFAVLASITLIAALMLFFSWDAIVMTLEKNREESSSDLAEHISSAANITSDASNLERINRWESAYKMFLERPVFGWGPGTYAFEYAPFQHSGSMTMISTNAGRRGNAHSEYIGPLAETGLPGSLAMITLILMVFYFGSRLYHRLPQGRDKTLILCTVIGFTTYAVHGFLNNYLDTDKASVPFWSYIAIIVTYDIYGRHLTAKPDGK